VDTTPPENGFRRTVWEFVSRGKPRAFFILIRARVVQHEQESFPYRTAVETVKLRTLSSDPLNEQDYNFPEAIEPCQLRIHKSVTGSMRKYSAKILKTLGLPFCYMFSPLDLFTVCWALSDPSLCIIEENCSTIVSEYSIFACISLT